MLDMAKVVAAGHFIYKSGLHGEAYVQKDKTIADPDLLANITALMAEEIAEAFEPEEIDMLVGIAPCSSILASRTAEHLGYIWGKTPKLVFAEKETKASILYTLTEGSKLDIQEGFVFKRGFDEAIKGKKAHLIEDVVTTGGSLIKLRELVETIDGVEITGASAEWSRSPEEITAKSLGVNIWLPLVSKALNTYPEGACPMDADLEAHPIRTDLGHGALWLAEHA